MQFKSKTDFITVTLSRQVCMMAKQYEDAINFTLGDPDLSTPKSICDAAYKAVLEGKTHYAPNAGIPELRQAICDYEGKRKNVNYTADQSIVTIGAVSAIDLSLMALINSGDEVIIIPPYWSQYKNMTLLLGGNPIILNNLDEHLNPDIEELEARITTKTKAIIINNPNNPSGHVYPESVLKAIAEIAVRHGLFVLADEVYDTLVYDKPFVTMASFCPAENLLLFNSCSKSFAMTGWRVGYMLGPIDFVKSVIKLQQNLVASVPTMTQYAALEAISNADIYVPTVTNVFERRRKVLIENLHKIDSLNFSDPEGTFYAFIDISKTGLKSKDFTFDLLKKEHVAVVPGIAYGENFDNFVRLAFTQNEEKIIQGIQRLDNYLKEL